MRGALRLWDIVRGFSAAEIEGQKNAPLRVVLSGTAQNQQRMIELLGLAGGESLPSDDGAEAVTVLLVCDTLATLPEKPLSIALAQIASEHANRRIALAARVPGFRSVVVAQLSRERAFTNGKLAAVSALPGIVPWTDWLLPATGMGDLILLTRNQIGLLLEVAACYDQPTTTRAYPRAAAGRRRRVRLARSGARAAGLCAGRGGGRGQSGRGLRGDVRRGAGGRSVLRARAQAGQHRSIEAPLSGSSQDALKRASALVSRRKS